MLASKVIEARTTAFAGGTRWHLFISLGVVALHAARGTQAACLCLSIHVNARQWQRSADGSLDAGDLRQQRSTFAERAIWLPSGAFDLCLHRSIELPTPGVRLRLSPSALDVAVRSNVEMERCYRVRRR
jgi:hypothetical protein